ncbi:hypothetical protein [Neptunomonas japonica]|uniref:Uncharacterized protein n=1 Tax=Neptunomonas japonica JAMM 1380 TaxID=1441457 RepID=A0A7R6PVR8_9GAMM|nr:hypothetical protein [Neptunomonas japonica]BBB31475.1 hypothetical protein NEJAP_3537 [Neptunomonas japonica JAMM 1380]
MLSTNHIRIEDLVITVKNGGPYTYFVTLPFLKPSGRPPLSLNESVDAFNYVIKALNRKLYGTNWYEHEKHMKGYVCIEDHKLGGYHFHALIQRDPVQFKMDKPNFRELFIEAALRLKRVDPIKKAFTYNITDPEHLDVLYLADFMLIHQDGYFPGRTDDKAWYILKQRRKPLYNGKKRVNRIYPLEDTGINLIEYNGGL